MSCDAYCMLLMKRAMARTDAELFGNRWRYEKRARVLAQRLIDPERGLAAPNACGDGVCTGPSVA